jgi:hypothetical protein
VSDSHPNDAPDPEAVDLVRRRLLLIGGRYIAPAVVASVWFQEDAYGQGNMGMGMGQPPPSGVIIMCPPDVPMGGMNAMGMM